jgi:hypothetical protein
LPEFSLHNTCELAIRTAAWTTALRNDPGRQTPEAFCSFPSRTQEHGRRRPLEGAARRSGKIPRARRAMVEARSQPTCNLCYTPPPSQRGHATPSHPVWGSACRPSGRCGTPHVSSCSPVDQADGMAARGPREWEVSDNLRQRSQGNRAAWHGLFDTEAGLGVGVSSLSKKRAFFKASTLRLSRARKPQRTLAAVSSTPLLDRVSTH